MRYDTKRRRLFLPGSALGVLVLLAAVPASADRTREMTGSAAVEPGQEVRIDFSVGELDIEGYDGDRVEVSVRADCDRSRSRCAEILEDLELEVRGGRVVEVKMRGYPKWNNSGLEIDGVVRVPRTSPVEVEMGVGELSIEGVDADLRVDLGVGEATIRVSEAAVSSVFADVGVGEATIRGAQGRVEGERSFLIGSEAEWSGGAGSARVRVDVGVGEVRVDVD